MEAHLPPARDLQATGRAAARDGRAVLALFSEAGCVFCERARREFLLPMQRNPGYRSRLAFVEVDVHADTEVRDFDGTRTTHTALARRYGIRIMPTVLLLAPDGGVIAEPLVGFNGSDFYGAYLDARIEQALAALKTGR